MTTRHATIVGSLTLLFALAVPLGTHATLTCPNLPSDVSASDIEKSWVRLQVGIPNITVTCTDSTDGQKKDYVKDMGQYIGGLYKYFVGVIGIIAAVMVFYGGLQWLTAGGNASRVKSAKETIFAALIAILIAFGSYTLLYTINPKLVVLNPPVLKVADTFLVSFDNTCPTTKYCLSGTNVGNTCTSDNSCPGAQVGPGACGLPLETETGGFVAEAKCGFKYKYKTIQGLKNTSETCIGEGCGIGDICAKGNIVIASSIFSISTINPAGVTVQFTSDPRGKDRVCTSPEKACESINDGLEGVGPGRHNELCQPISVTGAGLCQWYEPGGAAICSDPLSTDYCKWWDVLTCPSDYPTRVNGSICQRESVPDDSGVITFKNGFARVTGSCYGSTSGEVVYDGTLASNGGVIKTQCDLVNNGGTLSVNVKGICCMKAAANAAIATAADLTCNVSN